MRRSLRVAAWLAAASCAVPARPAAAQSGSFEYLQVFSSLLSQVRLNYVDSVGYRELVRAAIDGTLRALDPHSYFVSREDWVRLSAFERGELAGPGLTLEDVDSAVAVLAVAPRSPAERAGVLPGDRVRRVADTVTGAWRARDVLLRLAGEPGSRVRVGFERGSRLEPDTFSVTLRRETLKATSLGAVAMADSGTGYVRLRAFGPKAADEVKSAVRRLRGQGAARLILDLRGNPGGIVTEAVGLASLFLPEDRLVFRTTGRARDVRREYRTTRDGTFDALPLVLLIDERSASASEALAASLQDHDRALLVGRRSFGKALMQSLFLLNPTSDNVWLTIGHVVAPSGRVIQRRYKGLGYEQYRALGGQGGAAEDTAQAYRTLGGRVVRGGGGVMPDVELPAAAILPAWVALAADSGALVAVADSAAAALDATPAGLEAWIGASARWEAELLPPFLARARRMLGVQAELPPAARARLARQLAARAAEVRWGAEGGELFDLRTDSDVRVARERVRSPEVGRLRLAP